LNINLTALFNKPKGEEKIKGRRKLSAFLICLFIAALFWFLNALSKNYNATISFPVIYSNLPKDKVLTHELPKFVTLELNAQGFNILAYKFKFLNDSIMIDVGNLKMVQNNGHYESKMPTSSRLYRISRQLASEVTIYRVQPDTLYFNFGDKKIKEIPIKLNHKISFEKQHRLHERIIFSPSTIKVEGLNDKIDMLEFLETDSIVLNNLTSSVTVPVSIKIPKGYEDMTFSSKSVMVTVPVEKFTEVSVDIPIEIVNLPIDRSMKIFPEKIHITAIVGFNDFDRINEHLFTARVDYLKRDNTNRLPVEIVRHPEFVQIHRFQPQKVEYIIRKR
jgi:hypothetical protein